MSYNEIIQAQSKTNAIWGGALIILGVLAILAPWIVGITTAILVAILLTIAGVVQTIYAFKADTFWQGLGKFLFGGLTLVAGIAMLVMPNMGLLTITFLLATYFIVDGIMTLIFSLKIKPIRGWGWMLVSAIAALLLGAMLLMDWPVSGTYAIGILVGIRLIFSGIAVLRMGSRIKAISNTLAAENTL